MKLIASNQLTLTNVIDGKDGNKVYTSKYELSANQTGVYLSDLTPTADATNIPPIGSIVVAPSGKMYPIVALNLTSNPPSYTSGALVGNIKGPQGAPGADGKTTYIHFAYADDNKGTNFSLTDKNQQYQGYYSDYTEADSTDYTKYKWSDRLANVKIGGVNLYALSQNNYIAKTNISEFNQNISTGEISFKVAGADPYFGSITNKGDAFSSFRGVKIPVKAGQGIAVYLTNELFVKNFVSYYGSDDIAVKNYKGYQNNKFVIPASELDGVSYVTFRFGIKENTQPVGSAHSTKIKVEYGNVYTDWSPSPKDTQEQINNKADQGFTTQQLNELQERQQLQEKKLEAKALQDDIEKWYKEYLNYVTLDTEGKQKSEQELLTLSERIVGLNHDLGETKERWNFLNNYMEVGEEGLVVGKKDGTANIKVSDDRISMFSNGSEVMWITQNMLHIDNGVFTKTLQIGKYRFEEYGDNSEFLVIRYLGGN
nr:MAG TPA: tail protein [Caudoviricetes sp.]